MVVVAEFNLAQTHNYVQFKPNIIVHNYKAG